ncbi:pentapeptide repeat-containing protein [Archangium primigenium]|uniref:pentapeptide repeat-containing protein n=1 Tax=[Archangium] primigenium TaxID=2792470 RepID=UPI00195C54A7|nr:pentapeptide repeat-containing protein [Archangium primigenium]
MDGLTNVVWKDKNLRGERLELTDKGMLYFLSTGLVLRECTVVLKASARNILINQASFIDCAFEVKQELKNHQAWVFASLKGCRFTGRLSGCDFGRWPGYADGWEHGAIEDCDFSEARLDGCRFMGCEPTSLKYPGWPCFTILEPLRVAADLRRAEWPGSFGDIVVDTLHEQPAPTRALTLFAPAEAKRFDTTPEALRAVIERFDCILY